VLESEWLIADRRFATGSLRVENRGELDEIIHDRLADVSGSELQERLERASIAHARQRELHDVLDHPQLTARGRWREVDSPVGPLRVTLPPVDIAGVEPRMDPIPNVGEHTEAVLAEVKTPAV